MSANSRYFRWVLAGVLGLACEVNGDPCPCPGDQPYAGQDACGSNTCDPGMVGEYPYWDACGNGTCDPDLDGMYPDEAYDCDGDGELDSCEPCVQVSLGGLDVELLRGESVSVGYSVTPASDASNVSWSFSGYDSQILQFSADQTQLKIDYENIIENSDPVSYMDEQIVTITASADDGGSFSWTETFKLKKGLDSAWEAGKQAVAKTMEENLDPGEQIGNWVKFELEEFSALDPEGLVYTFTSFRINSAVSALKGDISSEWASFVNTDIWTGIPMTEVQAITVNESFSIAWDINVTTQMAGGDLSLSPSLSDAWKWVDSVNDNGFSSNLFDLQKTNIDGSVSGNGETSVGVLSGDLNFFIRVGHDAPEVSGGFVWGVGISVNLNY